ncbi:leucine-rich repeat domain-containing protein [Paenibacillus odorifer]|uniref:BIG2 domain-containing protein n=1 Tax=Paenibacillus odorifer TaxID=189426 RepID=A0A1R0Y9G0_9BACL|nr:leucine-rich repeat domain-containing protein [Paenibacillus odorifer]OMD44018.1 hypothetical protein BSK52_00255 [Paenibacillus odorifer]
MRQQIFKILISLLLFGPVVPMAPLSLETSVVSAESANEIANISDPNLKQAITNWLGKSVSDTVYKSDIVTKLPSSGYTFSANSKGISDLTGIEIFEGTGVTYLDLGRNNITELTPLGNISSLKQLNIESNQVSDLNPVRNLTSIKILSVNSNQITDISPINSLINLTSLDIANNKTADLTPLAGLVNLVSLNFTGNNIIDIKPLQNLTNLTSLLGTQNNISDLSPIDGLLKLKTLYLGSNNVVDLTPLSTLAGITDLNIGSNSVANLSALSSMTGLTQLIMNANRVQDLSPIADLSELHNIQASQNLIHNLSPLAGLTNLTNLNLQYNPITDVSPLSALNKLSSLNLSCTFVNPFSGTGQVAVNNILVSSMKKTTPVMKYGVISSTTFSPSVQLETGQSINPNYGFLQTSDGTTWSSNVSWHQAFRNYYASTPSIFISEDPSIASVDLNGSITGVAPGTTQITGLLFGWSSDYTEYKFNVVVEKSLTPSLTPEVSAPPTLAPQPTSEPTTTPLPTPAATPPVEAPNPLTWIKVTPSHSEIHVSETLQYKAEAIYEDGSSQDITESAIWSLDNPTMADIDKGFLTGKKFGSGGVIATWGGKSGVAGLLVKNLSVLSLTITPENSTIGLGQTQQFQAKAQYSNGTSVDVTNQAFWSVVYGEKASIDSRGVAKGLTEGNTSIWAIWNNVSGFANLSVLADVHPTPTPTPTPTIEPPPITSPPPVPEPSIEPTAITTPEPITTETPAPSITPSEEPQPVTEPIATPPTETTIAPPQVIVTPTEEPTTAPSIVVGGEEISGPESGEPVKAIEESTIPPKLAPPLIVRDVLTRIAEMEIVTVITSNNNEDKAIESTRSNGSMTQHTTEKHTTSTSIPEVPTKQQNIAQTPQDHELSPHNKKLLLGKVSLTIGVVSALASGFIWIILWNRRKKKEEKDREG